MHRKVSEALIESCVAHQVHVHAQLPPPIRSPGDVARALGIRIERITKTVALFDDRSGRALLAVCSINKRLNLEEVSRVMKMGRLRLASPDELRANVDYPSLGVSPIGVRNIPVVIDRAVLEYDRVLVGAGEVGVEVEVGSEDLVRIAQASTADITR